MNGEKENTNSKRNCELKTALQCNTGEVYDDTSEQCVTTTKYCEDRCKYSGGSGTYVEQTKSCSCSEQGDYDAGCTAANCENNNVVKYNSNGEAEVYQSDGTTLVATKQPTSVSGVLSYDTKCKRSSGKCDSTKLSTNGSKFEEDFSNSNTARLLLRSLGIEVPEFQTPNGRRLSTVTTITNPIVCISAGNMIEFTVDASTKSYPVYMKDSLLNTNDAFDYSGFLNLASTIEAGSSSLSTYIHLFDTSGTYVFMNSLDNTQQSIIKVVGETQTCPATNTVSAQTLSALYSLNLSTSEDTEEVDLTYFFRLVAAKIGMLVFLVGFVTWMHGMDKNWNFLKYCRKKKNEDVEKKRKEIEKKKRAVQLKANELKEVRDELAAHVLALKKRILELEEARRKKMKEDRERRIKSQNKLLNTLDILKKYIRKRAKVVRNEVGHDFEGEMKEREIDEFFRNKPKGDDIDADIKRRRKQMGEDPRFMLPDDYQNQIDQAEEEAAFRRLDKNQEESRHVIGNYADEERRKLEERLRKDGKLKENEIENILNDYDVNTGNMANILREDEMRQKDNLQKQLEARRKRRKNIFNEVDMLKEQLKKAKEAEAKEYEEHLKKMKEEENRVLGLQIVEEEKDLRRKMEKELDDLKEKKLKAYKVKLQRAKGKDEFKDILDEYTEKEKEIKKELLENEKAQLRAIEARINERKKQEKLKISLMKPKKSKYNIKKIEDKIQAKLDLLKLEADEDLPTIIENERKKVEGKQLMMLRRDNDERIEMLRRNNEMKYDEFLDELRDKYKEIDKQQLEDVTADTEQIQRLREELAAATRDVKRTTDKDEQERLRKLIKDLKEKIARLTKDNKAERDEKIKRNNQILQERAKKQEELEKMRQKQRWEMFEEEEKERDALWEQERNLKNDIEKNVLENVVDKYLEDHQNDNFADLLDQVYGTGSKFYQERFKDLMNKLQEKKARMMKYNFNSNLDKKIMELEKLNKQMNPLLEKLSKSDMPEDEYKNQLRNLMMQENEKRAEIEALAASREQESQVKTMLKFVDMQKDAIDQLNEDMNELREYALNPNRIQDKQLQKEMKRINDTWEKDLDKLKKEEEESRQRQIDEINRRLANNADLEKNKKDLEMLGMFEAKLNENADHDRRFKDKMQNYLMAGSGIKVDPNQQMEKEFALKQMEEKTKHLSKNLEREHKRQKKEHSQQLKEKMRELEMRKRERELLLNSLSMYKDSRAQEIANEDNFERLAMIIEEDLEVIDHEAYSYKPMKIYDLIRWKKEANDYLMDAIGGESTLLQRVARIEKYVGNLNMSNYARIKNQIS